MRTVESLVPSGRVEGEGCSTTDVEVADGIEEVDVVTEADGMVVAVASAVVVGASDLT